MNSFSFRERTSIPPQRDPTDQSIQVGNDRDIGRKQGNIHILRIAAADVEAREMESFF
jgi:hypothetical protein